MSSIATTEDGAELSRSEMRRLSPLGWPKRFGRSSISFGTARTAPLQLPADAYCTGNSPNPHRAWSAPCASFGALTAPADELVAPDLSGRPGPRQHRLQQYERRVTATPAKGRSRGIPRSRSYDTSGLSRRRIFIARAGRRRDPASHPRDAGACSRHRRVKGNVRASIVSRKQMNRRGDAGGRMDNATSSCADRAR
jgi:hypothetical protein